ncbi:reverse transcriptase/maturase family protein [Dysgonomonas macrotermitis]|uniref:Retron-type reverse transcriptase n=1 Tax=Dysgonomonas macrotermitis TaxID=1346286 RepID=A0A1M5J064_9BACT|nr:reverse transcriptase/maturase family protein [Dysgonomonas macrotermitis]SHG33610.1 Retron-type reverse transcriptase [Dysgonomonas macrotermitis]
MKRIGNLYDKVYELDNLYLAYSNAKHGKSKTYGVLSFDKNLSENILQLQKELTDETYRTSEYDVFTIHDPKERIIYRLPFRDRVIHHAIMNVLENIWTSVFISHSYSSIKGKGINGALIHLKKALKDKEGTLYCLKMDVRKFYPSIDHQVMKMIIRKKIKDRKLLSLLDGIIESAPGVPIGNYLSQFLANLYLSYFDHWLKEYKQVPYYFRYADDMIILSDSKDYLHSLEKEIHDYLRNNLKLDIKSNYQIFPVDARGIDFVGYVFFHDHILMRKRIKKNLCKRASKLNKQKISPKEYKIGICSYLGWAKHCNSRHLIRKVIKYEKVLRLWD